jgi:hypothetical protein
MAILRSSGLPSRDVAQWLCFTLRRFSVSMLEDGGRLDLKCLLWSYFRVGDHPTGTLRFRGQLVWMSALV